MHGPLLWSTDDHCSCLQDHAFSTSLMMEKNATIDQVMSKTDFNHLCVYLFICVYVFIYLFIYSCRLIQDLSSIIATDLLDLQVLLCITSHITTLGIGKL